jgi:hypothetical chaperone protein
MEKKRNCGLDFGTSNSAIAIPTGDEGTPYVLESDKSTLFFPEEVSGHYVGQTAFSKHFESGMPGRYIKSMKTILSHKSFRGTFIRGDLYQIEDLVSMVIAELKRRAEERFETELNSVVIGRPVRFSSETEKDELAEERLKRAVQNAGFQDIYFQFEPVAAAFAYELRLSSPETVLIGDLGAGTSDFTVIRLGPQRAREPDRRSDVLGSTGIQIGGDVLDGIIMWNKIVSYFGYGAWYDQWGKWLEVPPNIFRNLCRWEWLSLLRDADILEQLPLYVRRSNKPEEMSRLVKLIEGDLGYDLLYEVERAKIALSDYDISTIAFDKSGLQIRRQLSSREFEKFAKEKTEEIDELLSDLLEDAGVAEGDIDSVFLTGGTSLSVVVRNLFGRRFGYSKIREGDAFTSVAMGLSLSSSLLFS